MLSQTIDVHEAQTKLAELIQAALTGTEVIIITDEGTEARLVPIRTRPKQRIAGLHPGAFVMSDDFDAPLPDEFWLGEE